MRTAAIVTLLVAFLAAVILPNDIGTDDMPATGHKTVKARQQHLVKGKASLWFAIVQNPGDQRPMRGAQLIARCGAQAIVAPHCSLPLLI